MYNLHLPLHPPHPHTHHPLTHSPVTHHPSHPQYPSNQRSTAHWTLHSCPAWSSLFTLLSDLLATPCLPLPPPATCPRPSLNKCPFPAPTPSSVPLSPDSLPVSFPVHSLLSLHDLILPLLSPCSLSSFPASLSKPLPLSLSPCSPVSPHYSLPSLRPSLPFLCGLLLVCRGFPVYLCLMAAQYPCLYINLDALFFWFLSFRYPVFVFILTL